MTNIDLMSSGHSSWFRRRRWWVLGSCGAALLVAGLALASAVHKVQVAANRSANL